MSAWIGVQYSKPDAWIPAWISGRSGRSRNRVLPSQGATSRSGGGTGGAAGVLQDSGAAAFGGAAGYAVRVSIHYSKTLKPFDFNKFFKQFFKLRFAV